MQLFGSGIQTIHHDLVHRVSVFNLLDKPLLSLVKLRGKPLCVFVKQEGYGGISNTGLGNVP